MKAMPYQSSQTHPVLVRMMNNLKERNPERRSGALSSSIPKNSVNSKMILNHVQIVGRQPQLQLLNECYAHMIKAHTSELVMVHGPSGAGKSALVKTFVDSLPPANFPRAGQSSISSSLTLRMRLLWPLPIIDVAKYFGERIAASSEIESEPCWERMRLFWGT
jgi:predicted ATPase